MRKTALIALLLLGLTAAQLTYSLNCTNSQISTLKCGTSKCLGAGTIITSTKTSAQCTLSNMTDGWALTGASSNDTRLAIVYGGATFNLSTNTTDVTLPFTLEFSSANETQNESFTFKHHEAGIIDQITGTIQDWQGNWGLIISGLVLAVGAFIILYIFKHVVANAIVGIIALLVIRYALGIPIPLSPLVLIVTVLGGLGGVAALLICAFFGWLT